ncbi:putative cysteine peptidase [Metamycoplasma equirhinis]|uniref:putative cysteine peptidase n=1 Tax=Metamycoplasma equirhinis TaxID=92402 RepID=UPI003593CE27
MKEINLHWFGLLTITPCVVLSSNITKNEKHDKTIFKVTKTIQRFYGKSEQFKYIKKINANYLYAQYINYYAIIDRKDFSIIEIKKGNYNFDANIEYNFLYSNKRNENNINKLRLTSNKHFFPLENDKLDKLPNISNKIKDSWWWVTRNTTQKIGYTDQSLLKDKYDDSGLCEYIAISNILLYNHLFKNSCIFTDEEFANYFDYGNYNETIQNSSPTFKYYQYNNPDNSLVAKLWRLNKRWLNFYSYNSYTYSINKFLQGKDVFSKYEYDYKMGTYYYRTIENIRNDNPVIVSTAKTMHAFIIYGFDSETQMVLLNWLWGDNDSIVLVNYWKLAAAASALKIIFTMRANQNQKLETKKLFKYKNKMYNNEEIRKLFNEN